ncbi:hypothetical protein HMSSN139_61320 [Paenibacillus sp. HMSSN-139]|nr:hypothetical protein HMSSN139_61320 [Paenibacillus sp. HMSSN-139]
MRALITGIKGFVGRHLAQLLLDKGYEVWGFTRLDAQDSENNNCHLVKSRLFKRAVINKLV